MSDQHEGDYGRRYSDRLSTVPITPPKPRRLAYLYANSFEALIAVSAVLAAIAFFAHPESLSDTSIGKAVHPYDQIWNGLYCLGGLFVVIGLFANTRTFKLARQEISGYAMELAGLTFLGTAVLVNMIAAINVTGFSAAVATFAAVTLACLFRGRAIVSSQKVAVPVEVPDMPGAST